MGKRSRRRNSSRWPCQQIMQLPRMDLHTQRRWLKPPHLALFRGHTCTRYVYENSHDDQEWSALTCIQSFWPMSNIQDRRPFAPILPVHFSNDTGSNMQTLYPLDAAALGVDPNSQHLVRQVIRTPAGNMVCPTMPISMQIVQPNLPWTPLTPWYVEEAVINPNAVERLSGPGMRNHLYFCTAPGNQLLYISTTKTALRDIVPAGSG